MMARTIYFLSLLLVSMMPLLCTANCHQGILIRFSQDSYQVVEDNGPTQPVLFLSEPVDCCSTISVWVHVQEIDAEHQTNPEEGGIPGIHDIVSESYIQVLFPGGKIRATFDIRTVHDVLIERNETFHVSIDALSLPHGVSLDTISSAIVTIVDDDEAVVSFDKTSYTVEEKQGAVDVTLNLDKPIPFTDYTVNLTINDDTTTPCDYESAMHTIPIPFNTTSFDYTVVINEDDLYELDETFTLQITATSGTKVKIGRPASTTITITNRNNPIHVTLTAQETIDETAGALKVDLILDKPSPCCLRVYVKAEEESATGEGVDYGEVGDGRQYEVIFPAGTDCSSIEIPIINDKFSESDEKFTVRIIEESLPFGIELGDNTAADVLIIDNDIYLMFGSEEYTIYEHEGELCVTVEHDKPALFNTSIEIIRDRGSAIDG